VTARGALMMEIYNTLEGKDTGMTGISGHARTRRSFLLSTSVVTGGLLSAACGAGGAAGGQPPADLAKRELKIDFMF